MPKYKYERQDQAPLYINIMGKQLFDGQIIETDGYFSQNILDKYNKLILDSDEPYCTPFVFILDSNVSEAEVFDSNTNFDIYAQIESDSLELTINNNPNATIKITQSGLVGRNFSGKTCHKLSFTGNGCIYGVINGYEPTDVRRVEF